MPFDEEHLDEHHYCRGEIHRLEAELAEAKKMPESVRELVRVATSSDGICYIKQHYIAAVERHYGEQS